MVSKLAAKKIGPLQIFNKQLLAIRVSELLKPDVVAKSVCLQSSEEIKHFEIEFLSQNIPVVHHDFFCSWDFEAKWHLTNTGNKVLRLSQPLLTCDSFDWEFSMGS